MANVTPSTLGTLHEKLTVTINKEDYLPEFEKALKKYSKNIELKGFRKGAVPVGMVKKMHGQAIFTDEVLRVIGEQVDNYITSNKINYLARPLAIDKGLDAYNFDMNNPLEYSFDFEMGLKPTFEIPLLSNGKSLEKLKVAVSEEMINEEVEKIIYRAGKLNDIDMVSDDDDVLNVSFLQEGGEEAKQTNSLLVKYFTDEAKAALQGKKVGDTYTATVGAMFTEKVYPAIAADLKLDPKDEVAKQTNYTITLDKIGHVTKAAINEDLYTSTYPNNTEITDEASFRAQVKLEIQAYWDNQSRNRLDNDIFETLVHETPLEIPTAFLKRWLAEGDEKNLKTPEQVEKEWGSFDHSIRWQLISDKLMADNNIFVNQEELKTGIRASIAQQFAQMGFPISMDPSEDPEWLQPIIDKQMKDEKLVNETYQNLMMDKLFQFLEGKITVVEREVPLDEFVSNANRPHHHHHH
jgi:trigger factor